MLRSREIVVLLSLAVLAAACGAQGGRTPQVAGPSTAGAAEEELIAFGTVLENDEHGPQLCFSVLDSYPPQCGGSDIVNWSWAEVSKETRARGTTWGEYVLVGTYAEDRFRLTRSAVPIEEYDGPRPDVPAEEPLRSPCPEPEGGWRVLDPARASESALQDAQRVASDLPGFAGLWLDQSVNPAYGSDDEEDAELMNDPEKLVLDVAVTDDVAAAERALREVWGGALCVSRAEHTLRVLRRAQDELSGVEGMLSSGVDVVGNRVELLVVYDDGTLQRRLDDEYGAGLVRVTSALQPYPG